MLRVLNLAIAATLLLILVFLGLWVRSKFISDTVYWHGDGRSGQIWSNDGTFHLQLTVPPDSGGNSAFSWQYYSREASANRHMPYWRKVLPTWRPGPMDDPRRSRWDRVLTIPYWLPLLLFGALPLAWLLRVRRRVAWESGGRCPSCGYDVRATPERCPECGVVLKPAAQTAT